jgi:hypothetical protein
MWHERTFYRRSVTSQFDPKRTFAQRQSDHFQPPGLTGYDPWLIRKFVDRDAKFIFAPADKVMDEQSA